jgi:tetrahydromethanopterin S-methyltransferase subunit A
MHVYVYISKSFALRAVELIDLIGIIDVDEILHAIKTYCRERQLSPNITKSEEIVKTIT